METEVPKIRDKIFNRELRELISDIVHKVLPEDLFSFLKEERTYDEMKAYLSKIREYVKTMSPKGYLMDYSQIKWLIDDEEFLMDRIKDYAAEVKRVLPFKYMLLLLYSDFEAYYYPVLSINLPKKEMWNIRFSKAEKIVSWIFSKNSIRFVFKKLIEGSVKEYILFKKKFSDDFWDSVDYFVFVPLKSFTNDFGFFLFIGDEIGDSEIDRLIKGLQNVYNLIPIIYIRWLKMQIEKRKKQESSFFGLLNIAKSIEKKGWNMRKRVFIIRVIWKDQNPLTKELFKDFTNELFRSIEEYTYAVRSSYREFFVIVIGNSFYRLVKNRLFHSSEVFSIDYDLVREIA